MLSDKARKLGEEPAFPYTVKEGDEVWSGGMTLRMEFAKTAMQGMLSVNRDYPATDQALAVKAIAAAEALLEALVKDDQ